MGECDPIECSADRDRCIASRNRDPTECCNKVCCPLYRYSQNANPQTPNHDICTFDACIDVGNLQSTDAFLQQFKCNNDDAYCATLFNGNVPKCCDDTADAGLNVDGICKSVCLD